MRTLSTFCTLLILANAAALSGCADGEASVADAETIRAATPVPVEVTRPFYADINATYAATATLASDADAPVVARVPGEVVELLVEEGDVVTAGQVLARQDGERLRLEMLAAKASLEQARKEYQRNADLHQRGLISAAAYDHLQYDLEALRASYELKKLTYSDASLRAPISGVVTARETKAGQNLAVNQVAFRITDTRQLVAYLQIPQSELTKFSAGHRARVNVASRPGTSFVATITRISPTIDKRNGTFRATALIDNERGELAPGMFGRFTIAYERHANALLIPAEAILNEDGRASVYVVRDGEVMLRSVETGIEDASNVEILGGLSADDVVVVVGHSNLREGSRVLASKPVTDNFAG